MTRDAREVERKKVGLHKARRATQFSSANPNRPRRCRGGLPVLSVQAAPPLLARGMIGYARLLPAFIEQARLDLQSVA